eukprot:851141-Amphidinium_carterae.1
MEARQCRTQLHPTCPSLRESGHTSASRRPPVHLVPNSEANLCFENRSQHMGRHHKPKMTSRVHLKCRLTNATNLQMDRQIRVSSSSNECSTNVNVALKPNLPNVVAEN